MSRPGEINIERWDAGKDGELTSENMEKKLKSQGYQFTRYDFPPGMTFPNHTHGISKKDSILKGQFQFTMYGKTVVLGPGDMIHVPKDVVHNAEVVGKDFVTFYDATFQGL